MRRKRIPTTELEKRLEQLEKKLEDQGRLIHGIIALGGKSMVDRARELAKIEVMPYSTEAVEREELFRTVGQKQLETREKLSKKQLEEYKRIIENNNNNNH